MGVYNHFSDKEGLKLAAVDYGFQRLGDTIAGVTATDASERMYECGRAYRALALQHPQVYRLMFSTTLAPDKIENPARAFKALVQMIEYAQAAKVLRADDSFLLAKNVWSCLHGAVILELEHADPPRPENSADAEYESLLTAIQRGLAPR